MRKIVFATNNQNKIRELSDILSKQTGFDSFKLYSLNDVNVRLDIEETGSSYEENAMLKAMYVAQKTAGYVVVADDSGLEIEALNNEPGVFSARYMGENVSYEIKNNSLIDRLNRTNTDNREARFVCALAIVFENGTKETVRAEWNGEISDKIVGEDGFGYDPIFYLREYDMTAAQLSTDLKNKLSHRAKAFQKLSELKGFKEA